MSNLPQPYDRHTTTTTLLGQSNTILIDALPELFEGQLLLRLAALALLTVANWILANPRLLLWRCTLSCWGLYFAHLQNTLLETVLQKGKHHINATFWLECDTKVDKNSLLCQLTK